MPPKARITREMVVDAAFAVAREQGSEQINARTVAQVLGCSTQPVMYHFKTIADMKRATYEKADDFHTEFIMSVYSDNPAEDLGLNYIRFANTEKNLFRFLFQTNEFSGNNIAQLIESPSLESIISIISQGTGIDHEQARALFRVLFIAVHGYASMFANNEMQYDENAVSADLDIVFNGALCAIKGDCNE